MRMLFAGHQFFGALADSVGEPATQEGAVIEEVLQQTKVRLTQLVTQEEVGAKPRVEVLHQ